MNNLKRMPMIKILKNSSNRAVFTLNEDTTLTGSSIYYLFQFINDDTDNSVLFTGEDISENPSRFNEFTIVETGSTYTNLTASTINLEPSGFWKYNVYQQSSPTNLSVSSTDGLVETGKVQVIGTVVPTEITYTGQTDNNTVYYYE